MNECRYQSKEVNAKIFTRPFTAAPSSIYFPWFTCLHLSFPWKVCSKPNMAALRPLALAFLMALCIIPQLQGKLMYKLMRWTPLKYRKRLKFKSSCTRSNQLEKQRCKGPIHFTSISFALTNNCYRILQTDIVSLS